MMEEIIVGFVLISLLVIGIAYYFGAFNVEVNHKDVSEYIPDVNVTVNACEMCAKQCGFNITK